MDYRRSRQGVLLPSSAICAPVIRIVQGIAECSNPARSLILGAADDRHSTVTTPAADQEAMRASPVAVPF